MAIIALILIRSFRLFILPSIQDIIQKASEYLPMIWSEVGGLINILPYSSVTFIIGLILGLWKG